MKDPIDIPPIEDHEAKLEVALVDDFLRQRGHTREGLQALPEEQRAELLKLALRHAAEKLAEIGARAHYVKEIHREH
jgi:hypothetical protein